VGTKAKSAGRKMKIKTVDRNGGNPTTVVEVAVETVIPMNTKTLLSTTDITSR
jgi:hypothetical protein